MNIVICKTKLQLGQRAADLGAKLIRQALKARGHANIILATGTSQFAVLQNLLRAHGIDWAKVTGFHLDEYAGLSIHHPASFRLYLWQRFVSQLPVPMAAFHFINAEADPAAECLRLGKNIRQHPIDVAFVGLGENGHLAFNDPPADFQTDAPYIVVNLDQACRLQQVGEGWFKTLKQVPAQAISMSIRQIMRSQAVVCSVPDRRKAAAVARCLNGHVTPKAPGSILQQHTKATVYLDRQSATLLG
jgi:glucosamine-6-phosphate deaminase